MADVRRWLEDLDALAGRSTIQLHCTIASGLRGRLQLKPGAVLSISQSFDKDSRFQAPAIAKAAEQVEDFPDWLEREDSDSEIRAPDVMDRFQSWQGAGVPLSLRITVSLDKRGWLEELLGREPGFNALLFIFSRNFREHLAGDLAELEREWLAQPDQPTVVVLPEAKGSLEGEFLACFGGDALEEIDDYLGRVRDFGRLGKIRELCDNECHWDERPKVLTPDHLILESRRFKGAEADAIRAELAVIAVQLAVGYLADRTDATPEPPQSQFYGYKTCRVPNGREALRQEILKQGAAPEPLLKLYRSAYENQSADQLLIMRRLISQKLEESPAGNLQRLLTGAQGIRNSAQRDFHDLMRRNIGDYFRARSQLLEFLRRYSDEIAAAVSGLTSELISNLYKTLGAVVAAAAAAILTDQPAIVVPVTALLYFGYVVFILAYLLPSITEQQELKSDEYHSNIRQFVQKNLLTEEEIRHFQGKSFARAEEMFDQYFNRTRRIYLLLAAIAFLIAAGYGSWHLLPAAWLAPSSGILLITGWAVYVIWRIERPRSGSEEGGGA